MRVITAVLGLVASLATAQVASASTINVSGVGTCGSGAPTTTYTHPGQSWQFSFDLPSVLTGNPSFDGTNFAYQLNGVSVPGNLLSITASAVGSTAVYDLSLPGEILSLYGPAVSNGLTLVPGVYNFTLGVNDQTATGSGTVTLALAPAPVPEPSSYVLLGTAMAMGLGFLYFRRKMAGDEPSFAHTAN